MAATAQQMLEHAKLFTATERLTLPVWNALLDNKLSGPADVLLNSGLLLEHFQSLLDNDPTQRTPDQLAILDSLQQDFNTQVEIAKETLASLGTPAAGIPTVTETVTKW